jgi:Cys-rich four helix bundle protein (predicted Tat secretion target)
MNRRDMLALVGVMAASTVSAVAAEDHAGHARATGTSKAEVNTKLIDTASDCIKTGQVCLAHCFESFAAGDTSLAACARSVDQMMSVCGTLEKFAATGSSQLPGLTKVALAICEECEKECRKHADHHATCKACADACKACADACRSA